MNTNKAMLLSIGAFAIGLTLLCAADYALRRLLNSPFNLAIPEVTWFGLQIMLSLICFLLFLKTTKHTPIQKKRLTVTTLVISGIITYTVIIYGYILGSQVDSF